MPYVLHLTEKCHSLHIDRKTYRIDALLLDCSISINNTILPTFPQRGNQNLLLCLLSQVALSGFLVGKGRYFHMMPYIETYVDLF